METKSTPETLTPELRRLLSAVARAYWRAVKRELDREDGR